MALRELLSIERSSVTLDRAALDLAAIEFPDLDPAPWLRELDRIALAIADRAPSLDGGRSFN